MEKKAESNSVKDSQATDVVDGNNTPTDVVAKDKTDADAKKTRDNKKDPVRKNLKEVGDLARGVGKKVPTPGGFWNQLFSIVLLLILVTIAYSHFSDTTPEPEELSVSQVVEQVKADEIKEIIVRGSVLEVSYHDDTRNKGEAKKETDAAVTETLTNLGVTAEELGRITIDVQNETGFTSVSYTHLTLPTKRIV